MIVDRRALVALTNSQRLVRQRGDEHIHGHPVSRAPYPWHLEIADAATTEDRAHWHSHDGVDVSV
jgi:hypothetical protein